jgi:arylsulfatase A-like enzyme
MIVRWPGKIASGREDNQVWTLYDFFPTAVAIAQAPLPVKVDGVSELSLLRGGRARPRKSLYWEFHEGGFVQAARLSEWKGIRRGLTGTMELYNLAADPTESNNVAEQYPKIIRRLENIMKREHVESAHWPLR